MREVEDHRVEGKQGRERCKGHKQSWLSHKEKGMERDNHVGILDSLEELQEEAQGRKWLLLVWDLGQQEDKDEKDKWDAEKQEEKVEE